MTRYLFCVFFATLLFSPFRVKAALPVAVEFTLTHIAANKWRADYRLAEPVEKIDFGPAVGEYRKLSWRILTPGLALTESQGHESISGGGIPFSALSIEVGLYLPLAQGSYTPFDRMSDGGTDVFIGYFDGDVEKNGDSRGLRFDIKLNGLPNESVTMPDGRDSAHLGYAYFGPASPTLVGAARLILDPKTPRWIVDLLHETTMRITKFYDRSFQRPLPYTPLIMVSISEMESPGLSMKGGAVGQQVVYRLGGKALLSESARVKTMFQELVAHELAHVWQNNVSQGGVGEDEAWVHEGGAEAIALAALAGSGLFDQDTADAFVKKRLQECDTLNGALNTYRGAYSCGFKQFMNYEMKIFSLWKCMMEIADLDGTSYSSAMIDTAREKLQKISILAAQTKSSAEYVKSSRCSQAKVK